MDRSAFRTLLASSFQGNASLATAFWQYFILGQIALAIVIYAFGALLYGLVGDYADYLKVVTYPLWYSFLIWAMVSIWRCAKNSTHPIWLYVSRSFVVLYSVLFTLGLIQNA